MAVVRGLWLAVGVAVLVLPLLPVPSWIQAADAGPPWAPNLSSWAIGLVVVVVGGVITGRLSTRWPQWRLRWPIRTWPTVVIMAAAVVAMATWATLSVFASNPHLVDEMAQLFHARVFLTGAIAAPVPEHLQHFILTHTWPTDAGIVSQYPPIHSVLLAAGMALGVEWIVNPLAGGASLICVYVIAKGWYGPRTAMISAGLWLISAWVMFMSGTYMNHVTTVALMLGAWACLWAPGPVGAARALSAGVFFSLVAGARPLDAAVAAVPVALWLLAGRRWSVAALMVAGGIPGLAFLFWFNSSLFGSPLSFGYGALYGAQHGLGFHRDAWGADYTPLVALSNMTTAIRRLHLYLFEWPIPALLPFGVWAVLSRHRHPSDRLLALAAVAGPALYFFYWHSGIYVGPRFYYVAAPALVIGTARALSWAYIRARHLPGTMVRWDMALVAGCVITALWGTAGVLPARVASYRAGLPSFKLHPERELAALGVDRALVLVPESWGSRVILRLWDLGVTPGVVERAYRVLDTCTLHEFAAQAAGDGRNADWVTVMLDSMMAAQTEPAPLVEGSPDPTLRLYAREVFPPACRVEIQRDLTGFTTYVNLGWRNAIELNEGLVFARDLFERNGPLLQAYAGWELWRYAPAPEDPNGIPHLTRIRSDAGAQ